MLENVIVSFIFYLLHLKQINNCINNSREFDSFCFGLDFYRSHYPVSSRKVIYILHFFLLLCSVKGHVANNQ